MSIWVQKYISVEDFIRISARETNNSSSQHMHGRRTARRTLITQTSQIQVISHKNIFIVLNSIRGVEIKAKKEFDRKQHFDKIEFEYK